MDCRVKPGNDDEPFRVPANDSPFHSIRNMPRISKPKTPRADQKPKRGACGSHAQRLDRAPFGKGPPPPAAVEHSATCRSTRSRDRRCHHHILYTRIPAYRREHLDRRRGGQERIRIPDPRGLVRADADFRSSSATCAAGGRSRSAWSATVTNADLPRVALAAPQGRAADDPRHRRRRVGGEGPPVGKPQAVEGALQLVLSTGVVTVSGRAGMLKTYELIDRHLGWQTRPRPGGARGHGIHARPRRRRRGS